VNKIMECYSCGEKQEIEQDEAVSSTALLGELGKMTRRWRRKQGGAGGACCQLEEANQFRDEGRLPLIKELEAFIKEST